jgi:hypothetical protein
MRRTQHRPAGPDVPQLIQAPPAEPRWWSRLLDGAHPWGSFDAAVGRYGIRRYRLVVYPPGSTAADRRFARMWRGWPITGAALALLAIMLFGNVIAAPDTVLGYGVAAYVGIGALLFLQAGPARARVRSMSIILMPKGADVRELCKYAEWRMLVHMLTMADRMLATGAISLVEHEAAWWKAYDRLGSINV